MMTFGTVAEKTDKESLVRYTTKYQEGLNNHYGFVGRCEVCKIAKFKTNQEETDHKKTAEHLEKCKAMPDNAYRCMACERKFDDDREVIVHLRSKKHMDTMVKLKNKELAPACSALAMRYHTAMAIIQARVMVTQVIYLITKGMDQELRST